MAIVAKEGVYVGFIVIDPSIEYKITHRTGGGCTAEEVREAFQHRQDTELRRRPGSYPSNATGFGMTYEGRQLFASLVAVDESDGTWALKSAWPV